MLPVSLSDDAKKVIPMRFGLTARRVLLGCCLIISVFLVAILVVGSELGQLKQAAEEMRDLSQGIEASMMLGNYIREQYVHQAHLIITRDSEHAEHVESALESSWGWIRRLQRMSLAPEEKRLLDEIEGIHRVLERTYRETLAPLVASGETSQLLSVHEECDDLVTQATRRIDGIVERFRSRIDTARERIGRLETQSIGVAAGSVILAVLLAGGVAVHLARSIARPMKLLIEGTTEIARGNLESRMPVPGDDFELVVGAFNEMSGKLQERQRQLMEAERLATLGRLAAAVAHELNSPLGIILGYLKTSRRDLPPGSRIADDLRIIEDEANQCRRIISDLLLLARPAEVELEVISVTELIEETVRRLSRQEAYGALEIEVSSERALRLLGDVEKVKQVIANLVRNAAEAMPRGGRLRIEARRLRATPAGSQVPRIELRFLDSGPGIPPDRLRRIFEPFYTTKPSGTGLGLFICQQIVKAHHGRIEVRSSPGRGTAVTLVFPDHGEGLYP